MNVPATPLYNTKEVARLTGITPATLRKWEERYNAVTPLRLPNGYRGYTARDIAVLRWINARVQGGALVSVAAEEAKERLGTGWDPVSERELEYTSPAAAAGTDRLQEYRGRLVKALVATDATAAGRILDELFALYRVETVLLDLLQPVLYDIGDRWAAGTISEYQEHFSSVVIRDRLSSLRSLLPTGSGPHLVTACVPGELHEIGSLMVSLLALRMGCRVTHLSGSPSPAGLCRAAAELRPDAILLSVAASETLARAIPDLASLAEAAAQLRPRPLLVVGGQGVESEGTHPDLPGIWFVQGRGDDVLRELLEAHLTTKR